MYVPTALCHRVLGYLVKHSWCPCPRECLIWVTCELVDRGQQTALPSKGEPQPSHWMPVLCKLVEVGKCLLYLWSKMGDGTSMCKTSLPLGWRFGMEFISCSGFAVLTCRSPHFSAFLLWKPNSYKKPWGWRPWLSREECFLLSQRTRAQHQYQVTHKHLYLRLQGIGCPLLACVSTHRYTHKYRYTHK